jgi:hypothetical protein
MSSSRISRAAANGTNSGASEQKQQPSAIKRRHSLPTSGSFNLLVNNPFASLSDQESSPPGNSQDGLSSSPAYPARDSSTNKISHLLLADNTPYHISQETIAQQLEKIKKSIIDSIKNENKEITISNFQELLNSFVNHMCDETEEVLFWLLLNAKELESRDRSVGIFYANDLFEAMKTSALESIDYNYHPERMAHLRKCEPNANVFHMDDESRAFKFADSKIYIPICYSTKNALKTDQLAKTVNFLLSQKSSEIVIYLGIGEKKQLDQWLEENKSTINNFPKDKVKILTRSDMIKDSLYQKVKEHFTEKLLSKKSVVRAIKRDIVNRCKQQKIIVKNEPKAGMPQQPARQERLDIEQIMDVIKTPAMIQLMHEVTPAAAESYGGFFRGLLGSGGRSQMPSSNQTDQVRTQSSSPTLRRNNNNSE